MKNIFRLSVELVFLLASAFFILSPNPLLEVHSYNGSEEDIQESCKGIGGFFGGPCKSTQRLFAFVYKHNKVGFIIKYYGDLPQDLSSEEKARFSCTYEQDGEVQTPIYEYCYGTVPEWANKLALPESQQVVYKPLSYPDSSPEILSIDTCAHYVRTKKIVFLTGAGISVAGGIYSVPQLWKALKRDYSLRIDGAVKDVLHNPAIPTQVILDFYQAACNNTPTPAHYAITKLAYFKSCQILTGNFDRLHERAGIAAYHLFYSDIDKDVLPEHWQEIDVVIALGTSWDFKGLLARYRKHNPQGIIIAINRACPPYLAAHDFFLPGDVKIYCHN